MGLLYQDLPEVVIDHLSLEQVQIAVWNMLVKLSVDQQCTVLSNVFDQFLKESTCLKHVPNGFIQLAFNGMSHLKKCGRSNVIYSLVKSLGTMRLILSCLQNKCQWVL